MLVDPGVHSSLYDSKPFMNLSRFPLEKKHSVFFQDPNSDGFVKRLDEVNCLGN